MKKEAFICVVTLLLYVNGQICPTGWIEGPQGKKCYLFAKNHQRNWFEAQYVCQSMRAELLSVEDSTEMAWLKQELKHIINPTPGRELEWWTSLNNQANVSNWLWSGDVPLDETVIRWGSGEPNNHLNQERCGEICCPHYFNDKSCETKINYICELNKDTSPLTCDADQGWEYHSGSCYKYFPRYRSWNDSLSDCKDLDSNLATVTDTYTQSSIAMMANFQQSDSWIGLYKKGQTFYYTNSTTATGIDIFLQPNRPTVNKERICMSVDGTRKDHTKNLYGDDCTNTKPFICQKPEGICKPGMIQHQSTCYYVSASTQIRKSANNFCRIVKMSLVDITSTSKAKYLLSVLQKKDNLDEIWIGLKRQGNDWYWPSTGERPSLNYWANIPSEKNDSVNDCAYMNIRDGGKWHNNFACDAKLKFVCESPAITSFTTLAPPTTTTIPTTVTTSASTSTSSGGATGPETTPAIPCNLEYCEDVFDSAKELEKHSPVLMEAARNYSEVAHCIPLRSRVQCLRQQEKQCLHHFQYMVQVVGLQKIMDILDCSNNTSAAVFDPSTMVLECRTNKLGLDYRGKLSTTNMGRTCQAWSVLTPHGHKFQRELVTEKNYCRNPDNTSGGPWCYTTDVNQRWEFCDVPYCAGAVTPATTTTTPATVPTPRPTSLVWSNKCGLFWEDMSANSDVCHHFDERLVTWMDARQKCKDLDGELASITSLHEQYYLTGRLKTSRYGSVWIGANSRAEDEGWRWSDESPFSFLHWMPDQPDGIDNNENCVSMDTSGMGTWEDKQCDEKLGFVCRKSVAPPVTPALPPKSPVVNQDQMYDCQEGWMGYRSNCYFVNRTKTTWQGAVSYCRLNGAELTSIAEEGEHDFITSQLPNKLCYNTYSNDTECTQWAAKGECERNPVWMAQRCHLACNLCISDCKNRYYSVECDHWAKVGECYKNHKFMLTNCALSCGICDGAIYGGFWIGLNDKSFQMSFKWSDDAPVTYTKWAKGEPNNEFNGQTREDCIIMLLKNGYWNDVNCGSVNPGFICKKRKQVLDKVTESPFSAGCVNDSIGYDAYCYGIKDETADWYTAENICAEAPYGHLATINDRYVQAFLSSQLVGKTGSYWIGLSQDMSSGAIESWANGFPVLFTHWAKSHTGSIDEDAMCVAMTSDHPVGLWETKNCTLEKSFICEYPRTGYTTSTTTTTTTLAPTCPAGWNVYSNYCYKRLTKKMSWMKGRDYCRQLGADLVSIHSDQEDGFIKRTMIGYSGGTDIWIGLNDRDSENGFVWSDGSPFDYSFWNPKEPNDKYDQEDCTMRSKYSSGWNDDNCYKSKKIICKIMKGMPLLERNDTFTVEYCDADKKWLYFNDFCYFIVRYDSQRYADARKKCLDKNSDLLSVHSQHESNWLLEMINQQNDMWIGLNKLNRHFDSYKWSDWTPVDYLHWAEHKPSASGIYRCAKISASTGRWYDTSCFRRLPGYICKRRNDTDSFPITPPPLPPVQGGCMSGFTRAPFNDKCYQVFRIKKTWRQANAACSAISKGTLVTIQSELEQLFVSSLLINVDEKVWIGLTDEHSYNKYYWHDGSDLTYTNWHTKEPNGYSEHCGDMFTNIDKFGKWNDEQCSYSLYYMCQGFQNSNIPTALPGSDSCPSDYEMYDSMCYKYIKTANTWNESLALCQQDGGSLATIRNIPEKYFVNYITFNKTSPFWIGLYKVNTEDITYTWISGWPVVYTDWNPDKKSPTKSCISSGTDFWTDENCDKKLPAMCQVINKSPPTTPETSSCEEGGYAYKEKCYYPSLHDRLTWIQANDMCKQKGLHLSSIQDLDQIEFMINLVLKLTGTRLKLWIGLNKMKSRYSSYKYRYRGTSWKRYGERRPWERLQSFNIPNVWSWTDESPYLFRNWNDGEPSSNSWRDLGEKCVEMKPSGKWNDINCANYERAYFCRGDPVKKEPPTTMPSTKAEEMTVVIETTEATTQLQNTETKTTTPSPVVYPSGEKSVNSEKIGSGTSTTLTTGQVIGIIIGIMGCVVIVFAILFVIRFNKQKGVYNTNGHSFSNALYLKTTENITDDDPADMGSTVKICGTDTL